MMKKIKKYKVIIRPAIVPTERHEIEDAVKKMGYKVTGGGTNTESNPKFPLYMSQSVFDFQKEA